MEKVWEIWGGERKRPLRLAVRRTAWYCRTIYPLCLRTRHGKSEWWDRQTGPHLLPAGIIPLFDGHRWRLKGGQDNVVGRGQLYPEVIGAAAVCSGGKPGEDREAEHKTKMGTIGVKTGRGTRQRGDGVDL